MFAEYPKINNQFYFSKTLLKTFESKTSFESFSMYSPRLKTLSLEINLFYKLGKTKLHSIGLLVIIYCWIAYSLIFTLPTISFHSQLCAQYTLKYKSPVLSHKWNKDSYILLLLHLFGIKYTHIKILCSWDTTQEWCETTQIHTFKLWHISYTIMLWDRAITKLVIYTETPLTFMIKFNGKQSIDLLSS